MNKKGQTEAIIGVGVIGIIAILVLSIIVSAVILQPIRDNKAQQNCEAMGFETYVKFNTYLAQTTPVALVCGTLEERMIKDGEIKSYVTNGDGNIIVQEVQQ